MLPLPEVEDETPSQVLGGYKVVAPTQDKELSGPAG